MSNDEAPLRRSTRTVSKPAPTVKRESPPPKKARKVLDPGEQLQRLLTDPKSKLATADISDILSYEHFVDLPEEWQQQLCTLLPPTAFVTYQPTAPSLTGQPANGDSSSSSIKSAEHALQQTPALLDPMFFTNPFFLSAAGTFQDHLYSGWLSDKDKDKLDQFLQGVHEGTMHAQWKDEEWSQDHPPPKNASKHDTDLAVLARQNQLREGDILAYRHTFASLGVTVQKDLLVQSIHPASFSVTLLLQPGTIVDLPPFLLQIAPPPPEPPVLTMESIMDSASLEDALLDVDGRVPREARVIARPAAEVRVDYTGTVTAANDQFSGRAAKSLSLWRWNENSVPELEHQPLLPRGGREYCGTIHYLRRS